MPLRICATGRPFFGPPLNAALAQGAEAAKTPAIMNNSINFSFAMRQTLATVLYPNRRKRAGLADLRRYRPYNLFRKR